MRLRRAVPAPAGIGLDRGVGAEHDDGRGWCRPQRGQGGLGERQRCDHVDLEDPAQGVEWVMGQSRQRRRAQRARVVHEHVEAAVPRQPPCRRGAPDRRRHPGRPARRAFRRLPRARLRRHGRPRRTSTLARRGPRAAPARTLGSASDQGIRHALMLVPRAWFRSRAAAGHQFRRRATSLGYAASHG